MAALNPGPGSPGVDEALTRISKVQFVSRVHFGPVLRQFSSTATAAAASSPNNNSNIFMLPFRRNKRLTVKMIACFAVLALSVQVISTGRAGGGRGANDFILEEQSHRDISDEEAMDPASLARKLDHDRKLTNERKLEEIRARAAMIGLEVPIPDSTHPLSPNFSQLLELRKSTKNQFWSSVLEMLPIGEGLRRSLCQHFWAEETIGPGKLGGTWQEAYVLRELDSPSAEAHTADYTTQTPITDVAYILPVTTCPDVPDPSTQDMPQLGHAFRDVVALLKYSACSESKQHMGAGGGSNDYTMYAIVHPDAVSCQDGNGDAFDLVKVLEDMGYWVRIWGPPVAIEDLTDDYLKSYVDQDGGFRTYAAMQAYKLTNHPVGIFVSYDTMIYHNLDHAINYMSTGTPPEDTERIAQPWYAKNFNTDFGVLVPDVNAMFHRRFFGTSRDDYHGISMDFMMFRPDLEQYVILKYYLQNGFYDAVDGWFGKGVMGMSFSGMLSWFYSNTSNRGEELDYCVYGNFFDPPFVTDGNGNQNCQNEFESINSATQQCTDCRTYDYDDIKTINFAYCGPPWSCTLPENSQCRTAHRLWFEMRKEFEELYSPFPVAEVAGTYYPHIYYGYCTQEGYDGYTPMNYNHDVVQAY